MKRANVIKRPPQTKEISNIEQLSLQIDLLGVRAFISIDVYIYLCIYICNAHIQKTSVEKKMTAN